MCCARHCNSTAVRGLNTRYTSVFNYLATSRHDGSFFLLLIFYIWLLFAFILLGCCSFLFVFPFFGIEERATLFVASEDYCPTVSLHSVDCYVKVDSSQADFHCTITYIYILRIRIVDMLI